MCGDEQNCMLLSMLGVSMHSMCNFLWDQEGLPFTCSLPDAYWSIKDMHLLPCTILCTFQTNVPSIYMPCTFQQPSLVPMQTIFLEQDYNAPFIYIYMPCTPYRVTYMLDLSFSTYYGLAKLQIVYVENKYNPIA